MVSSELQYFAFSNPVQVVTLANGKNRPTRRPAKNPDYDPRMCSGCD